MYQILAQPQYGLANPGYPGGILIPNAQAIPGYPGYPPLSLGIVLQGYQFN